MTGAELDKLRKLADWYTEKLLDGERGEVDPLLPKAVNDLIDEVNLLHLEVRRLDRENRHLRRSSS